MKENVSRQRFERAEESFPTITAFPGGLSADFVQTVFLEREKQLEVCCGSGGKFVE
jgi:hypothetical protein